VSLPAGGEPGLPDTQAGDAPEGEPGGGHLRPTGAGPVALFAIVGLILGWSVRPLALRWGLNEPVIGTGSVVALFLLAAVVAVTAYLTARSRREGTRVSSHHAVNKLVLAKACVRVGAITFGGYLGFAIAHIGVAGGDRVTSQIWHAALAAVAGLLVTAASIALESACRIPPEDRRE